MPDLNVIEAKAKGQVNTGSNLELFKINFIPHPSRVNFYSSLEVK